MTRQTAAAKKAAEAKKVADNQAEQTSAAGAEQSVQTGAPDAVSPNPTPADGISTEQSAPAATDSTASQDNPPASEEPPTPEPTTDDEGVDGVWIRSVSESRRRCGYRFTREGVGIALEALTGEEVEALQADPELVVEFCAFSESGERTA